MAAIEVTGEMVSAFELASWANGQELDVGAGLAAVLAIVARDYVITPAPYLCAPGFLCRACSERGPEGDGCGAPFVGLKP